MYVFGALHFNQDYIHLLALEPGAGFRFLSGTAKLAKK